MSIKFSTYEITSPFGMRSDPITKEQKMHKGVDYGVPYGTEIQSTTYGTVDELGYDPDGFGTYVKIKDWSNYTHTYAHLQSWTVKEGEQVNPGQVIGVSGATGRVTGPHLHYQVNGSSGDVMNPDNFVTIGNRLVNDDYSVNMDKTTDVNYSYQSEQDNKLSLLQNVVYIFVMLLLFVGVVFFVMKSFDIKVGF